MDEPRSSYLRGRGEHILFVDDEKMLTTLAQRRLSSLDYRVTVSTEPRAALALFRADPQSFDLVITDRSMPQMTGIELAAELVRIRPDIPIILLSGSADDAIDGAARTAGVRRLARKPLATAELAAMLRDILD